MHLEMKTMETNDRFEKMCVIADKMSEVAVKVASKGEIAIDKEELYKALYPMFINKIMTKESE